MKPVDHSVDLRKYIKPTYSWPKYSLPQTSRWKPFSQVLLFVYNCAYLQGSSWAPVLIFKLARFSPQRHSQHNEQANSNVEIFVYVWSGPG